MGISHLHDALVHEMRDMLSAERQITKALRKLSRKAQSEELKECFQAHLEETEGQIERLEQAFESMGAKARARHCEGMSGLIEEAEETLAEVDGDGVMDAVLIAAAQKVEHYEISGYGTLCTWAEELGHTEAQRLFSETLEEEKKTDEKLTKLAMQINQQAQAH